MNKKNQSSPVIGRKILQRIVPEDEREALLGDFEEIYKELTLEKGKLTAWLWYWVQIIIIFPSFITNLIYWSVIMFANYLKITLRNIKRHKGYSFINIFGLAVGIACCILILFWVYDEWSYNRFNENRNRIYRVYEGISFMPLDVPQIDFT